MRSEAVNQRQVTCYDWREELQLRSRELRKDRIGASDAPVIMGVSPWKKPLELWEEKVGIREQKKTNAVMQRGIDLEPIALEKVADLLDKPFWPLIFLHKSLPWMMATLDGYSYDGDVAVEIKCAGKKDHGLALEGKIPPKYIPQLQHQMEVCGLNKIFYYSFDGKDGILLELERDHAYIEEMIIREKDFYECMVNMIPPV